MTVSDPERLKFNSEAILPPTVPETLKVGVSEKFSNIVNDFTVSGSSFFYKIRTHLKTTQAKNELQNQQQKVVCKLYEK